MIFVNFEWYEKRTCMVFLGFLLSRIVRVNKKEPGLLLATLVEDDDVKTRILTVVSRSLVFQVSIVFWRRGLVSYEILL